MTLNQETLGRLRTIMLVPNPLSISPMRISLMNTNRSTRRSLTSQDPWIMWMLYENSKIWNRPFTQSTSIKSLSWSRAKSKSHPSVKMKINSKLESLRITKAKAKRNFRITRIGLWWTRSVGLVKRKSRIDTLRFTTRFRKKSRIRRRMRRLWKSWEEMTPPTSIEASN